MAKPYEQEVVLDANGKPLFDAVDTLARKIDTIQKTIQKIQQDSFKSAKDFNSTIDANVKALQKASAQMRTLTQQDANERRRLRQLAESDARQNAGKYGTNTTAIGYQFEREKALAALRAASNEKERIAALKAVELANARLRAIQAIAREEERAATAQLQASKADNLAAHRARLQLARSTADQQIRALGTEDAIIVAKERQIRAESRLAAATAITRRERMQELELANAELRAVERLVAAQTRAARQSGGLGGGAGGGGAERPSRLQNILTPGYAAAAFARTSVYGAAALGAYGAFNAAQQGFGGTVQMQNEFQQLQAIANATDEQMQSLKGSILGVAESSRYAVTDIIKISETLAQAGVSASNMEDVLKAVTALATASGSTPDEAVQLVTSALGSFQLGANEATRVANLMTEALNRTKLTVQQVGQAIQYVGATAYEQNISLEQLLATIGSVAQAGVKSGSTIGTGFRQFLVDLQEPSKKLAEQLKLLGLSAADVDVSVRGLPAVLDTLKKAGFGAAQAYEGLEVRAAAFYLTAKNNVDIADQLQLSFAYTNASIVAQERAMNSLTAQWQRFKNILQITVSDRLQSTLTFLQNLVEQLGDRIEELNKAAQDRIARQSQGRSAYGNTLDYLMEYDLTGPLKKAIATALDGPNIGIAGAGTGTGIGSWLLGLEERSDGASEASKHLETQLAQTTEKVDDQKGKLGELDKELVRLITQKESLRDNDTRSAAETATLTTRFVGLANQLVITGNRYDDLVAAARRYRNEQLRLLGVSLQTQSLQYGQQARQSRGSLNQNISTAQASGALMGALTPQERQALATLSTAGVQTPQFSQAYGVLASAIDRLARAGNKNVDLLNKIVGPAGTLSQSIAQVRAIQPALGDVNAQQTPLGTQLVEQSQQITALIERMNSQANGTPEKAALTKQAVNLVDAMEKAIRGSGFTPGSTGPNASFLRNMAQDAASFRKQIQALNTATDEEVAASKAKTRAEEKAERDAAKGPKLTQAQFDAALAEITGKSLAQIQAGSGVRTKAEQNRLHALGLTKATGDTSQHSTGGIVRDVPTGPISKEEGERLEQLIRQGLKNKFGGEFYVRFESGQGRNQGSGPHVHAGAKPGMRVKPTTSSEDDEFKYQTELDQSQLEIDRRDLALKLKEMAKATTRETFNSTAEAAGLAMDKVNQDLQDAALNELANAGVGPGNPQYAAKMAQVQQQIDQNIEEFQNKVVDAMVKNAKALIKSAQEAFEAAIAPSQHTLAMMQGAASGLNRYSLRNQVPDFTHTLADSRVAQAQETADRARLSALPGLISQTQSAMAGLQVSANSGMLSPDHLAQVNVQIVELQNNMLKLVDEKDALQAAFGAEGMLPTTFTEGLQQAIAAYKELHNVTGTFTQLLSFELTGAIETVHTGLTTMFSSIIDGSRNALQAIGDFAKSMLAAISQIVAKILATQVINLLFKLFGAVAGPTISGASGYSNGYDTTGTGQFNGGPVGRFNGGPIPAYAGGGMVTRGHNMRDSVLARLSKGEFVMRRAAVESVGEDFMRQLNRNGAKAVEAATQGPSVSSLAHQEVNVWMVKPEEQPPMGPNDVVVAWQRDVLSGGESRRLIKRISREP